MQFGRSDAYFVCRLKPLTTEIILDDELEAAVWMPIKEFRKVNKHPMLDKVAQLVLDNVPGYKEIEMWRNDSSFKMYVPEE
jgi:hypothetical protein